MSRKDHPTILHTHIAPTLAHTLMRTVLSSCRLTVTNQDFFEERASSGKNMIFVSWHNRLTVLPYYYHYRYGFNNLTMMVSQSRDGEMLKRLLEKYGIETVRGSTSRGGASAIKTMIRVARAGRDTAVSLDGSKGPRCKVQLGALLLAQITGLPLVPLTVDMTKKIVLKTWDRMMIPLPFGRVYAMFADPMYIPRDAKNLTIYQQRLQETMERICAEVEAKVIET